MGEAEKSRLTEEQRGVRNAQRHIFAEHAREALRGKVLVDPKAKKPAPTPEPEATDA